MIQTHRGLDSSSWKCKLVGGGRFSYLSRGRVEPVSGITEILVFKPRESQARLWDYEISEILVFKPGESRARLWDYGIIEILIFKLGESRAHWRFSYLRLGRVEPVFGIMGLLRFSYLSLGRAEPIRDSCI